MWNYLDFRSCNHIFFKLIDNPYNFLPVLQLNAGITTQLLLSLFKVKGVLHYGIAGNANPKLQIGDVTIPQYWAHTGLWNWQVNKESK